MIQPLVLGVVILGLTVGSDLTVGNRPQPHTSEYHAKGDIQPLPLSVQTRARVLQPQVTRATLTGHKLTEAHFFGRRDRVQVSIETNKNSNKG